MIPRWDDSAAYPSPKAPMLQWAWEFLRRNPEYQRTWQEYASGGVSSGRDFLYDKFGIIKLCDPQEEYGSVNVTLLFFRDSILAPCISWFSMQYIKKESQNNGIDVTAELTQLTLPQTPYEVVIKFAVRNDIKSQLAEAEEQLTSIRELPLDENQKFSLKRIDDDLFPLYVRLLDAETQLLPKSDTKLAQLVLKVFEPDVELDSEEADKAKDRFRRNINAARYLRDIGYKTLALAKYRPRLTKKDEAEMKRWAADNLEEMLALNKSPEK